MPVIAAKDKGVRWRVFEREMLEKHFGNVHEVNVQDDRAVLNMCSALGYPKDLTVLWHPNTEYANYELLKKMRSQSDRLPSFVNCINSWSGWHACHSKLVNFVEWSLNNVKIPEYQSVNGAKIHIKLPFLYRIDNECSGRGSELVTNMEEWPKARDKVNADAAKNSAERKVVTNTMAVKYLDTSKHGYNRSYRIIVAGNRVICGYARMSPKTDWVAIAGKFTPDMRDVFIEFNQDCEKYYKENESEIVRAVKVLNLNLVGVDIIPVSNEHYFLEVQPGFACGYADPKHGYKPPFYNPSYPALVDFLKKEMDYLKKVIPTYCNVWLNKDVMFDECFKAIKAQFFL